MALIVRIYVNDKCIKETWCQRIKGQPGEICTYSTDVLGDTIKHHYNHGAEILAIKLLKKGLKYNKR